jgi:hypothetical protein
MLDRTPSQQGKQPGRTQRLALAISEQALLDDGVDAPVATHDLCHAKIHAGRHERDCLDKLVMPRLLPVLDH